MPSRSNTQIVFAAAATLLAASACGCPEDSEVCPTEQIAMGAWESRSITSEATGENHSYMYHPPATEGLPTMVMLPGLLFDGRIYANMAGLSERFELVALNYPESSDRYTSDQLDLPKILDDFVDTLGIDRFVLLGNSLGGFVAMQYFRVQEPPRVDALVLVSTRVFDATDRDRRERERMFGFLSKRSDRFLVCMIKSQVLKAKKKNEKLDPQINVFNVFTLKDPAFYRETTTFMGGYDGNSGAELIDVPTLVLHGSEDQLVEVERTEHTRQFLPHAKVVILEGVAHEGPFTHGDEFTTRILDWYDAISVSAPPGD